MTLAVLEGVAFFLLLDCQKPPDWTAPGQVLAD